ncbi:MAG: alkene reductase [Rhodospirillaceae bacterium]|jgi:N-ethylmaleimide reductase|nr:alkene reductase [Rhodospirillaceae bacterium]MBT3886528.1 alkene reductase [Rhodospirillaceae bacterium]MBT4118127.1 alkene reductase [Rhodospirillaceae bacterium]MBT4719988.1 alkene reductase [Rhodospirillaceae bacterium]MBT4750365.1 alkene reductase [Rhodospirillaceae bacterium]
MSKQLFSSMKLGRLDLPNRIIMAPMNRARCDAGRAPTDMVGEYYSQRASAGLLITEASSVSRLSQSRPNASAIYQDNQVEAWGRVAKTVHAAGGRIFQQIYHLGRKSDPSRMPDGLLPLAPSAIAAKGEVAGLNGPVDFAVPRALETDEIPDVVEEFRLAARGAGKAGMDGIEIHGANAYLVDQFLKDKSNRRVDGYGGDVAARVRFLMEVTQAAIDELGADRVGVRISPHLSVDGIGDSDVAATFTHVAGALGSLGIAYLHLVEAVVPGTPQAPTVGSEPLLPAIRTAFRGAIIVNGGYDQAKAEAVVEAGLADAVAFARLYISNPDLVDRFRLDAPLAEADAATTHGGGAKGYIDYPVLQPAAAGE